MTSTPDISHSTAYFSLIARPLLLGLLFILAGCSRYSVSLNDNVVYEPPSLFSEFLVQDPALSSCIKSTIAENNIHSAEQLHRLVCPAGSIATLDGIELFDQIEYLGLAGNRLISLAPIAALTQLKQVDLSDNKVEDFSLLLSLKELSFLNAKGNVEAQCESLQVSHKTQVVQPPQHCDKQRNNF